MFHRLIATVLVIGLAVTPSFAADDAKEIIAKAVKANGGEEYLAKNRASVMSSKGTIDLPGLGEVEFTQEVSIMLPDKLKDSLQFSVMGQAVKVTTLVNGDKVSINVNGQDAPITDEVKKALNNALSMIQAMQLVPLLNDTSYKLSVFGEAKVEEKPAVGVTVSKKGESDITIFFDKKTHLVSRIDFRTVDTATGNEVLEERIVQEYETKDGKPVPKKVTVKRDGKKFLQAEVTSVKRMEKLDESEFK
jgi:hypothetical protein